MPLSQDRLVDGLKQKESGSIKMIYRDVFPSIRNFILKNNGNQHIARDIFQEAIIVLYNKLNTDHFKLECSIKTFLFSVSKRLWLNELKKSGQTFTILIDTEDNSNFSEQDEEIHDLKKLQLKIMHMSMEILGNPCQKLLKNFYIAQHSMQEIADEMGYTNRDNAKNQKYKCLQRLKKIFFKEFEKYRNHAYTR